MEVCEESEGARTAAQRRAEIRRRKLMQNSEDRMKKIVGFSQPEDSSADRSRSVLEPRFHLDLDRHEPWPGSGSGPTPRASPHPAESDRSASAAAGEEDSSRERPSSPRRGLRKYLSRLDDAVKLRGHLAGERPAPDRSGTEPEDMDPFGLFRLAASVALALFVRIFVCQYLSIFAPFLTLELGFMGLHKYFPKVEKKSQATVLTAALLLSGIPSELISRSMDTYRKMSLVFSDLCVYFFSFVMCHELLLLCGSDGS